MFPKQVFSVFEFLVVWNIKFDIYILHILVYMGFFFPLVSSPYNKKASTSTELWKTNLVDPYIPWVLHLAMNDTLSTWFL